MSGLDIDRSLGHGLEGCCCLCRVFLYKGVQRTVVVRLSDGLRSNGLVGLLIRLGLVSLSGGGLRSSRTVSCGRGGLDCCLGVRLRSECVGSTDGLDGLKIVRSATDETCDEQSGENNHHQRDSTVEQPVNFSVGSAC